MSEWQIVLTLLASGALGPVLVIAHIFLFEDQDDPPRGGAA